MPLVSDADANDRHDPLLALRIPSVRAFALGRLLGGMGMLFVSVAVGWELYERTGDPWALGLVGMVQVIPAFVLTIPAGIASDRYPRRTVSIISYAIMGIASAGLAVVSWTSGPVELVYLLLAITGAARAFGVPATNTLLAQILTPKEYANAYAWLISSFQVASIGSPALAGLLIALTGSAISSYLAAAAGQLGFVLLMFTLPRMPASQPSGSTGFREIFAGVDFIRRTPVFLAAISLDLFAVLLGGAVTLLPVFAKDILDVGPSGLGMLRSAPAIGALLAALVMARLPAFQRPGVVLLWMVVGFGVTTIGFGLSTSFILSLVLLFINGALDSVSMVLRGTLEQVITPDRLRGRVSAINSLFIGLSNELGAFRSGAAAAIFGTVASVVGGGVGTLIVVALVPFLWPQLLKVGPLHTLRPEDPESEPEAKPQPSPA